VDAVALEDGGRFRPLPVVVRTRPARVTARSLLERGERSLRAWLEALGVRTIDEATWTRLDPGRRTLRDVDAPSDLDAT
jgi:molybdopterin-guanine dinucleotide biosynthesis protein A